MFERKPKVPVEAASPLAEALTAALTALNPVEVAPAPADSAESVSVPLVAAAADSDPANRKPVLSLKSRKTTP